MQRRSHIVSRPERNLLLVVDDEVDFLELIEQIGEGVGCEVITADSATRFREQLATRHPALILLDLQMPGMDGIEALRYLARQGINASVLLASGMDRSEEHTSELQSRENLVCRLLLEKKK